jgi:hypothetical protein
MQAAEFGSVSAAVQAKLHDLQYQWAQAILNHMQQLRAAMGETRFHKADEFIRSGQSMFQSGPLPKREAK